MEALVIANVYSSTYYFLVFTSSKTSTHTQQCSLPPHLIQQNCRLSRLFLVLQFSLPLSTLWQISQSSPQDNSVQLQSIRWTNMFSNKTARCTDMLCGGPAIRVYTTETVGQENRIFSFSSNTTYLKTYYSSDIPPVLALLPLIINTFWNLLLPYRYYSSSISQQL